MRILSIGNFGRGWDGSICDEEHIAYALEGLGHKVERWQREDTPFGSTPIGKYDFVLIAQWNGYPENLVPELKKITGAPVVYWAFDYQYDKGGDPCPEDWHVRLASEADLFLSKESANKAFYEALGAKFRWLPQDFAPEFLNRNMLVDEEYDVIFTGSYLPWSPERTEYLKAVDAKFKLHIFSVTPDEWKAQGFKRVHEPVMDEGLNELCQQAKINLSIDWKLSPGYWSDRNAQIMACGGFVLFRHVPMSETVFKDYIAYFSSVEECIKKIRYYLKPQNEQERVKIAQKGYDFAHKNLMVKNRVQDLLVIVGEIL